MRKDGGPAFPPNAGWRDDDKTCRGMSLRDYFAAAAMNNCQMIGCVDAAEWCYQRADAMLAERNKSL